MDFKIIEEKWRKYWEEHQTFKTDVWDFSKPKYYALDMFPYPSGVALHCGHVEGYTATDIVARMKRMQGYNVLHPMGFDSFGLPAEQYAIKTGNHPEGFTKSNIETFKSQLRLVGLSYDWDKEISTCDKEYYHWTQWIFKQLYKDGLATLKDMPVNWCEELGTVLANDEVIDGKSERGGFPVVRKNMKQWVIDMPRYADKLLSGLESLNWPESTKEIQRNWIGKSTGALVDFQVKDHDAKFTVFTTRPDTLFGATYCVLAPEHELVEQIMSEEQKSLVLDYKKECAHKSELERTELNKEKTGVFTGAYAINPVTKSEIPIWISDYVLATYGTGAIMAVPAHDDRDFEFAKKFNLPIVSVLAPKHVDYENPSQEGKEDTKRDTVIIVAHYENEYLGVRYQKFNWQTFPMGGIEKDEDVIEAAKRELFEETGCKDIKSIRIVPFVYQDHFYAAHKGVNRLTTNTIVEIILNSKDQEELSLTEQEIQEPFWIQDSELSSWLSIDSHKIVWDYICSGDHAFTKDGIHINSEFLDGLNKEEAIDKMILWLEENQIGSKKVNYRLRDWIFARQRYWGEPIPIVHYEDGTMAPLDDAKLPLVLPELEDYSPSKTGASPLNKATDWVNVEIDGKKGKMETSTMPGSAGSSWYFLRYIDPHNDKEIANKELLKHWMPVDLYVGGPEHAVGHLLYSRMWNRYLYDKGIAPTEEPFQKLVHQGMILGANGIKMGKRFPKYSVNPNDIIRDYGADTLRFYEMFMGPLEADKPWSMEGVIGAKKFLDRVWRLFESDMVQDSENKNLERIYHQTVKKVTNDLESLNFNTAISQMMIFINAVYKESVFPKEYAEGFVKLLNPIAPFITEEIWEQLGHNSSIAHETWPTYEEEKTVENEITIGIQINGKLRSEITIAMNLEKDAVLELALKDEKVQNYLAGKEIVKSIVVPNKIVNLVIK